MSLYQYPKTKHKRSLKPRVFKRYPTYKRFLQWEFARVCVYCRQPDSHSLNQIYSVDHYRPKGLPKFAHLLCEYSNLFYCCSHCNSRKNNYWPVDERAGPYIVNPCDHEMASHLRFNAKTGRIEPKGVHGLYTEDLLQLNDDASIKFRLGLLASVVALERSIAHDERVLLEAAKKLKTGSIDQASHDEIVSDVMPLLDSTRHALERATGTLPLARPKDSKKGVKLTA